MQSTQLTVHPVDLQCYNMTKCACTSRENSGPEVSWSGWAGNLRQATHPLGQPGQQLSSRGPADISGHVTVHRTVSSKHRTTPLRMTILGCLGNMHELIPSTSEVLGRDLQSREGGFPGTVATRRETALPRGLAGTGPMQELQAQDKSGLAHLFGKQDPYVCSEFQTLWISDLLPRPKQAPPRDAKALKPFFCVSEPSRVSDVPSQASKVIFPGNSAPPPSVPGW